MDSLPDKIVFRILSNLDYDSFLFASEVCRQWNKVIEDNIDFFSSYFGGEDGEEQEEAPEVQQMSKTEEDEAIVKQILAIKPTQYYALLGVIEGTDEGEIRSQYRKLALLVHPDRNKAKGSKEAFQMLKKAFDAVMSGYDPEDPDTQKVVFASIV
eukprot:TRINITY_DN15928_c0_g1_i2.p1 TRINITY_DN15928_c0_g1~~TRINITY_DN15928_c0_g1_i2.p1  ORF type:complete len:167 (-),score=38.80 TRINITY_DN15928_c0_g1_i2:413-877(-)